MTVDEAFSFLKSLPPEWGASQQEVCEVESHLGVRLPPPLRELMLCTGGRSHMAWLFPSYPDGGLPPLADLPGLQEAAREILADDISSLRPDFPFVTVSEHQGYWFAFVRADGTDPDPEILSYREGHGIEPAAVRLTVRQYVAAAVREFLR